VVTIISWVGYQEFFIVPIYAPYDPYI